MTTNRSPDWWQRVVRNQADIDFPDWSPEIGRGTIGVESAERRWPVSDTNGRHGPALKPSRGPLVGAGPASRER
jgi:hypothetical protein